MEHLQMFPLALWDVSKKTQGSPHCPSHWDWGMFSFKVSKEMNPATKTSDFILLGMIYH